MLFGFIISFFKKVYFLNTSSLSRLPLEKSLSIGQYRLIIFLLFFIMGVGSLPSASAFYILGDLGGGIQTASWGVSFYLLGNLSSKPLAIIWGRRIGSIKLMKICLWFILGLSFLLTFVPSYYSYLVIRYFVGLASGPVFLICTSTIARFRSDKTTELFLIIILFLIIVPILAAAFGAIISYQMNWQVAFYLYNLLLLPILYWVHILFHGWEVPTQQVPMDTVGFFGYLLTIGCLGFCLVTGQTIDGFRSIAFNLLFFSGCIGVLFLIFWNRSQPYPIFCFSLFKKKIFFYLMLTTFSLFALLYAMIVLLSFWLHLYVNYSLNWIALSLLATLIGPIIASYIFSLGEKIPAASLLCLSLALLSVVSFFTSTFNVEVNLGRIVFTKLIAGAAFAMALPPLVLLIKKNVSKEKFASAFCLFAIFRMGGGFAGVAYFIMLWERRAAFYYQRLGGELTFFSQLTKKTWMSLNFFRFTPLMKEEGLNTALVRQSQALALNDCYRLIAWIMLALAIGAFFLLKKEQASYCEET